MAQKSNKKPSGKKKSGKTKPAGKPGKKQVEESPGRSWMVWAALGGIVALFLVLRVRNFNALLGWDEAQLALTVKSYGAGVRDVWSSLSHIHPPLYLWLMVVVTKVFGTSLAVFRVVSIAFSLGTLLVTYSLARYLFSEKIALLTALSLAILEGAAVMDIWVKQDPMVGFLIVLTIYLFVRGRWKLAGLVFGLGMLTKETAVFALMVLVLYSIASWETEKIKQTAFVAVIGFILSFWWYLLLSTGVGHFWQFFTTGASEGTLFKKPFWFYFAGLPADIGWILLALLVVGIALGIYRRVRDAKKEYLLPVVWFLSIYLFVSISVGKPYWMVEPAFPAIALLCGISVAGLFDLVPMVAKNSPFRFDPKGESVKVVQYGLVAVVFVAAVVLVGSTGYFKYNHAKYPSYWDFSQGVRKDALYLKARADGKPVLVILNEKRINRDAILTYYLGTPKTIDLASSSLASPRAVIDKYAIPNESNWIYIESRADVTNTDAFLKGLADVAPYRIARNSKWGTSVEMTW